jgi:hypothetical protein
MSVTWDPSLSPEANAAFSQAMLENNYYGKETQTHLLYKTVTRDGSDAARGIWINNNTQQIADVVVFGVIKHAEIGPYGNQVNAPENSWDVSPFSHFQILDINSQQKAKIRNAKRKIILYMPRAAGPLMTRAFKDIGLGLFNLQTHMMNATNHMNGSYLYP